MAIVFVGGCAGLSDEDSLADAGWEVRVDLRPFEDPISTYVEATPGGDVERFSYSASRFLVFEHRKRPLTTADAARLESLLTRSGVRRGLQRGGRVGDGLGRGDLVQVWAVNPRLGAVAASGFLHRFSGPAGELIETVLELGASADDRATPVAGYARSEPIERERRRAIERRGLITMIRRDDLPPRLAAALTASWERPGSFVPLDSAAVALFEAAIDVGREIFIDDDQAVYQTALFRPDRVLSHDDAELP